MILHTWLPAAPKAHGRSTELPAMELKPSYLAEAARSYVQGLYGSGELPGSLESVLVNAQVDKGPVFRFKTRVARTVTISIEPLP